jgi:hypothetical protein
MDCKKDGGPAFPRSGFELSIQDNGTNDCQPQDGMSLRDWFSGMALQAVLRNIALTQPHQEEQDRAIKRMAALCYQYADAMIAARS